MARKIKRKLKAPKIILNKDLNSVPIKPILYESSR